MLRLQMVDPPRFSKVAIEVAPRKHEGVTRAPKPAAQASSKASTGTLAHVASVIS